MFVSLLILIAFIASRELGGLGYLPIGQQISPPVRFDIVLLQFTVSTATKISRKQKQK